jgi:hypothetical protein
MNGYARINIAIILLMWTGISSANAQENIVVQVNAASVIQGDDFEGARLAAIEKAKKQCVEKVILSDLLSPSEYRENTEKIEKLILNKSEPYIAQFTIENEEIIDEGKRYEISVNTNILKDAVKIALVENRIVNMLSKEPMPTVMILISERFETRVSGTRTAETILINLLQEKGFKVIDPYQKKLIDLRNRLYAAGSGNEEAALQAATNFKANYVIIGEAAVTSSDPLSGTDLKARYANLSLKIVESSSGQVFATESGRGKAKHIDELTGGNWALEEAANKVGPKILKRFESLLEQKLMSGAGIVVDLYGLEYERQIEEIETVLKKIDNVVSVFRRFYFSGVWQFEVKFKGSANELAKGIKKVVINGQALDVIEILPRYLRVKQAESEQIPQEDTRELLDKYLQEKYKQVDMERAREQDKELMEKINALAKSQKINDEQKKQLYAAQKEIEEKRKEAFYREKELEKRTKELQRTTAYSKGLERKYASLARELEGKIKKELIEPNNQKKNLKRVGSEKKKLEERYARLLKELEKKRKKAPTGRGVEREDYKKLYQEVKKQVENLYKDKAKSKRKTYTTSRNRSNAQNNKAASAMKYLDSINKGVELVNQINKLISLF